MKSNYFIIITILLVSLIACSSKYEPVIFFQDIESGNSPKDVTNKLNADIDAIVEDTHVEEKGDRPEFSVYRIQYMVTIKGIKGKLVTEFYNSKLRAAFFFPDDEKINYDIFFKGYAAEKNHITRGNLRFWSGRDINGKLFIAWEDIYLSSKMSKWIADWS